MEVRDRKHKIGIITKASSFGSGSHHGLFVLRFIPPSSLLCWWWRGKRDSVGSFPYAPKSVAILQRFPMRNWRTEEKEKPEYFTLPSLLLVPPWQQLHHLLSITHVLLGFRFYQAHTGPELRSHHILLLSLQFRDMAANANFWVSSFYLLSNSGTCATNSLH